MPQRQRYYKTHAVSSSNGYFTRIILSLDFSPFIILNCDFFTLKWTANIFKSALFALPPTGGAVRYAFSPPSVFFTSFLAALGITLIGMYCINGNSPNLLQSVGGRVTLSVGGRECWGTCHFGTRHNPALSDTFPVIHTSSPIPAKLKAEKL